MQINAPSKPGSYKVTCTGCGTVLKFTIGAPAAQGQAPAGAPAQQAPAKRTPAKTEMPLGGFGGNMRRGIIRVRKSGLGKMFGHGAQMVLRPGSNIIGRFDRMAPSDFNLSDQAVSRRSLEIFVDSNPVEGINFRLTVHKAVNPVYHNGRQMHVGDSVALKFGDAIRLGTTTLDFIPENN